MSPAGIWGLFFYCGGSVADDGLGLYGTAGQYGEAVSTLTRKSIGEWPRYLTNCSQVWTKCRLSCRLTSTCRHGPRHRQTALTRYNTDIDRMYNTLFDVASKTHSRQTALAIQRCPINCMHGTLPPPQKKNVTVLNQQWSRYVTITCQTLLIL
jgi:hypothetical protein